MDGERERERDREREREREINRGKDVEILNDLQHHTASFCSFSHFRF